MAVTYNFHNESTNTDITDTSPLFSYVENGNNLIITPVNNLVFTSVHYADPNGIPGIDPEIVGVINSDGTVTLPIDKLNSGDVVRISVKYSIVEPRKFNFIGIDDTTGYFTYSESNNQLIIVPKSIFIFKSGYYIKNGGIPGIDNVDGVEHSDKTITFDLSGVPIDEDLNIHLTYDLKPSVNPDVKHIPVKYDGDRNYTLNIQGDNLELKNHIPFNLIATPNKDYEFVSGTITFTTLGQPTTLHFIADGSITLNYDTFNPDVNEITIKVVTKLKDSTIPNFSKFSNMYLITKENFKDISEAIIIGDINGGSYTLFTPYNFVTFITTLYKTPFNIPDSLLKESDNIIVGKHSIDTNVKTIDNNYIEIDLGTIKIDSKYNNSFDYINTEMRLHLPYIDIIKLENVELLIDDSIKILYRLNIENGTVTIMINRVSDNVPIYLSSVNMYIDYPIVNYSTETVTAYNNFLAGKYIKKSYVEIIRNVPFDNVEKSKNVNIYGSLKDYDKYVEFDLVEIDINCFSDELELLKNVLSSGIYI